MVINMKNLESEIAEIENKWNKKTCEKNFFLAEFSSLISEILIDNFLPFNFILFHSDVNLFCPDCHDVSAARNSFNIIEMFFLFGDIILEFQNV